MYISVSVSCLQIPSCTRTCFKPSFAPQFYQTGINNLFMNVSDAETQDRFHAHRF